LKLMGDFDEDFLCKNLYYKNPFCKNFG